MLHRLNFSTAVRRSSFENKVLKARERAGANMVSSSFFEQTSADMSKMLKVKDAINKAIVLSEYFQTEKKPVFSDDFIEYIING